MDEPDSRNDSGASERYIALVTRFMFSACTIALLACERAGAPRRPVAAPDTSSASGSGASVDADAPAGGLRIALDGEGVRLIDAVTGSARPLGFGSAESVAVAAATVALGAPRDRSSNSDCGAGPLDFAEFPGGLLLALQDHRFVGWTVRRTSGRQLQTMAGIGLGSTRAELESAYSAKVERSSLGIEFYAGGLQGILESGAVSARITDLWAGTNCVAR